MIGTQKLFFIVVRLGAALTELADGLAALPLRRTRDGDSPPALRGPWFPRFPCCAGKFSARDGGTVSKAVGPRPRFPPSASGHAPGLRGVPAPGHYSSIHGSAARDIPPRPRPSVPDAGRRCSCSASSTSSSSACSPRWVPAPWSRWSSSAACCGAQFFLSDKLGAGRDGRQGGHPRGGARAPRDDRAALHPGRPAQAQDRGGRHRGAERVRDRPLPEDAPPCAPPRAS